MAINSPLRRAFWGFDECGASAPWLFLFYLPLGSSSSSCSKTVSIFFQLALSFSSVSRHHNINFKALNSTLEVLDKHRYDTSSARCKLILAEVGVAAQIHTCPDIHIMFDGTHFTNFLPGILVCMRHP